MAGYRRIFALPAAAAGNKTALQQKWPVSRLTNVSGGFVSRVERGGVIHVSDKAACAYVQVCSSPGQSEQLPVELLTAHQVPHAAS